MTPNRRASPGPSETLTASVSAWTSIATNLISFFIDRLLSHVALRYVGLPTRSVTYALRIGVGRSILTRDAAQPMQNQPAVAGAGSSKHLNSLLRLAVGVIRSPSHEGGRLAPSIQMSSRSFPARILSSHALPSCALGRRSEGRITDCRAPFGTRKSQ